VKSLVVGLLYAGGVSSTIHLPDELVARLEAEAVRRGLSVDEVAAELLVAQLPEPPKERPARRHLAFVAIGASTSGRRAADAEEMLAEGFGRD
jgi:hypothetical protein